MTQFHGGDSCNVIPDSVVIGGTFRAFNKKSLNALKKRIEEVFSFFTPSTIRKLITYEVF